MRSARKIIKIILLSIMVIVAALFGYVLLLVSGVVYKGNASVYSVENSEVKADSPLKSKSILFLGSSVTHGVGFKGTSFVEYLEKIHGVNALKEALGGTTLVDLRTSSYIQRLKALDRAPKYDAFICQLSTNDATKKLPLGNVALDGSGSYDTSTVAGAIEEVISYVSDTWRCPIIFYTGT
ncbi:MAG: SGNH/GDSL hydrolase family protein, partial [Clostridiales bacterium]|nr:SGNH/GDSL hydrolase family protein [Clostridiales bacterium]